MTLWDNMLENDIAPGVLLDTAVRALAREPDEQNAQRILSYAVRTYWRFLPPADRASRAPALEAALREGLARAGTPSQKAAWFNAFRDTVSTPEGVSWLERIWRREERVPGLTLAEQDEIAMALELAVRQVPGWASVLSTQLDRTTNPDRKARFAFVMPALSADAAERDRADDGDIGGLIFVGFIVFFFFILPILSSIGRKGRRRRKNSPWGAPIIIWGDNDWGGGGSSGGSSWGGGGGSSWGGGGGFSGGGGSFGGGGASGGW